MKVGDAPAGSPWTDSVVEAAKPWTGATVTVDDTEPPAAVVSVAGVADTVKSGADAAQASAAVTSRRPWPYRSSGPTGPRSTAEEVRALSSVVTASPGWAPSSSAAAPETWGAATEVPGQVLVPAEQVRREHRDAGGHEVREDPVSARRRSGPRRSSRPSTTPSVAVAPTESDSG